MAFRLPQAPTFFQKHWRLVLAVVIFVIMIGFVIWFVNRAQTRTQDLEKLAEAQGLRDTLGLYAYFRNDYPPAAGTTAERPLGQGDAICLDKSDEGLRNVCDPELLIARRLPQTGFVYQKSAVGNYELAFQLQKRLGSLFDVDKDGKIDCKGNKGGIECI